MSPGGYISPVIFSRGVEMMGRVRRRVIVWLLAQLDVSEDAIAVITGALSMDDVKVRRNMEMIHSVYGKFEQGASLPPTVQAQGEIYFILNPVTDCVKIGFSANPRERLTTLQTGNSASLTLIATVPGTIKQERQLHKRFSAYRVGGEWFDYSSEIAQYLREVLER